MTSSSRKAVEAHVAQQIALATRRSALIAQHDRRTAKSGGSAIDIDLNRCVRAGDLLSFRYRGDEISVSLRAMNDKDAEKRRYEGAARFLRPGWAALADEFAAGERGRV